MKGVLPHLALSLILATLTASARVCDPHYRRLANSYKQGQGAGDLPTLGVEIEGGMPRGKTRADLVVLLKRELEALGLKDVKVRVFSGSEKYFVTYEKKGFKYVWEIKEDPSVTSWGATVEVASPVLRDAEDFAHFTRLVSAMRDFGIKPLPGSAGVHFHVGFPEAQTAEVLLLSRVFDRIEPQLKRLFATTLPRRLYARRQSAALRQQAEQPGAEQVPLDIWLTQFHDLEKFRALNILALKKFGTVEFRLFNSTLNPEQLDIMRDFCVKLVIAIRTKDPRLLEYFESTKPEDIRVEVIAQRLGMKLAEAGPVLEQIAREARATFIQRYTIGEGYNDLVRNVAVIGLLVGTTSAVVDWVGSLIPDADSSEEEEPKK